MVIKRGMGRVLVMGLGCMGAGVLLIVDSFGKEPMMTGGLWKGPIIAAIGALFVWSVFAGMSEDGHSDAKIEPNDVSQEHGTLSNR